MMNSTEDWKAPPFRHMMINRLEDALQQVEMPIAKPASEMENQVFIKSQTKDDYTKFMTKLLDHINNEIKTPKQSSDPMVALKAMTGQPGNQGQIMNVPQRVGPPQMTPASNLLQTLNRPNLQNKMPVMQQNLQPGMMRQMGGPMQHNTMHGNVMGGLVNQMSITGQMGNTMNGPLPNRMTGVMNNQNLSGQVLSPMNSGIPHNQMNMAMNPIPAPRKMVMVPQDGMIIASQSNLSFMPRAVPNQFIRQNTPPSNQQTMQMNTVGNMIPSPVLAPSPSPVQSQNAAMVASVIRPTGPNMVPSPNSNVSLNTPGGQSQPTPSPLSSNDEQAYQEKVRQLSKYVEPLRRLIQRSGSGDHEKTSKMKKLLEILSSGGQKITMEVLLKCETVLEKLDIKNGLKEHPLIEAISTALQSPNANHTFRRTFEPVMSTLNGKPLKNLPRSLKRKYVEEPASDIPEVLQGEIARLDQRFKVSLDPVQQNSSKCVYLVCWLDDRHLPCIPPVQITIPVDYPNSSPQCDMSNYEYGATKFLQLIQNALQSRISKLPPRYTMSQLLDTWENSVRETCSLERFTSTEIPSFKNE